MVVETRRREIVGHKTEAYGANPADEQTYELRYKVVDMGDLVSSHTDTLTINPEYPKELQPRIRERAASRMQIDNMARGLNPKVLLRDTGFLDTGPMIVGEDNVVESGNGRVLALRKAMADYPEKYRLYRSMLINSADNYGLSDDEIEHMKHPVLVRERLTKVDRVKFAAEANTSNVLAMSPFEQAVQDAGRLPDKTIQGIEVGEDESIDEALRRKSNSGLVARFYESIPANERATIVDAQGNINPAGMTRLKMAIFTKTYAGESGQRLARIFSETLDPNIKNLESAMFQSLPDMAKAEALIGTGAREKDLSVAGDMAEVIDVYSTLKKSGISVGDYLKQGAMFEERLSPLQKTMLAHMDSVARSPKKTREFIRDTAERIVNAPAKGQVSLMGDTYDVTKEAIVYASINKQRTESGQEPVKAPERTAADKGLAESGPGRSEGVAGVPRGDGPTQSVRQEEALAPSTSVQVGLSGFGHEQAQVQMFGEVSGKESKKETLIDVEKEKAREAAKPLPGQIGLPEAVTPKPEGQARVTFNAGDIDSTIAAAKRHKSDYTLYVFATARGYRIHSDPPPGAQQYVEVRPDGSTKHVSFDDRIKEQEQRWKTRTGEEKPEGAAADREPQQKPNPNFMTRAEHIKSMQDYSGTEKEYVERNLIGIGQQRRGNAKLLAYAYRDHQRAKAKQVSDPRSAHAEAIDRALQAKTVVGSEDEWKPRNRVDLNGVDTKHVVTIRTVPEKERTPKEKPQFRINRKSGGAGRGMDLGADIVRDRRGRHLRL